MQSFNNNSSVSRPRQFQNIPRTVLGTDSATRRFRRTRHLAAVSTGSSVPEGHSSHPGSKPPVRHQAIIAGRCESLNQQESPRQQEPVSLNCGHWGPTFRAVTVAPLCFTFPVWENLHADPNLHRPESLYWKQSGAASDSLDPRPPPVAGPPPRTRAVWIPPWENLHSLPNLHCPVSLYWKRGGAAAFVPGPSPTPAASLPPCTPTGRRSTCENLFVVWCFHFKGYTPNSLLNSILIFLLTWSAAIWASAPVFWV